MKILDEIRLVLCGLCFSLSFWLAPKNNPEGIRIVKTIKAWARGEILNRNYNELELIRLSVCKKHKITVAEIKSPSRKQHIVKARNEAMSLCKKQTGATLEEIGRCFNRNHSTVLYAILNTEMKP